MIPYVVDLQSDRLDRATTRFVAPLALRTTITTAAEAHYLAPHFTIEGQSVVLDVFNLTTILTRSLGTQVASLANDADRAALIRALDELVSTA